MYVLLLRHVDVRDLVLILAVVHGGVHELDARATRRDALVRSHGQANLIRVVAVAHFALGMLHAGALDGTVEQLLGIGLQARGNGEMVVLESALNSGDGATVGSTAESSDCVLC